MESHHMEFWAELILWRKVGRILVRQKRFSLRNEVVSYLLGEDPG